MNRLTMPTKEHFAGWYLTFCMYECCCIKIISMPIHQLLIISIFHLADLKCLLCFFLVFAQVL